MMTPTQEVLEVVRELPGLTVGQIKEYTSEINSGHLSAILSQLYRKGLVAREKVPNTAAIKGRGGRQSVWAFRLNESGERPQVERKTRKTKTPTDTGYEARLRELQAQLGELEEWKAAAIERYPELRVDPVVLKARRVLADVLEADGDGGGAAAVTAGKRDASPAMKAVIAALSQ